ncbi:MAG: NADPH-dependent FMN reductase [Sphingomonadaceae bacterium]
MLDYLLFYGSYRPQRNGIRLARYISARLKERGHKPELVDAKDIGLPILERRTSDYGKGEAPGKLAALGERIAAADAFIFVAGEYNHGVQPGLKNLVDHFLKEWQRRPAGIASYSIGGFAGIRALAAWRTILPAVGVAPIPASFTVPKITSLLDENGGPTEEAGEDFRRRFDDFADELQWWAEAVKDRRSKGGGPA